MRIGVVGDTHNRMTNVDQIVSLFEQAQVERVIHTGDITQPAVLERFARLEVPLLGVYGNNDASERDRLAAQAAQLGMDLCDPPRTIEWAGRRILILHDPEFMPDFRAEFQTEFQTVPESTTAPDGEEVDLVLHGHTHRHRHEHHGETLIFNPGECAGFMAGKNAVGMVDLSTLAVERLFF